MSFDRNHTFQKEWYDDGEHYRSYGRDKRAIKKKEESIENEWVVESLGQTESRFDYSPNNERELCSLSSLSTIWPNT
jgi:hypothetical protein